MMRTVKGCEVGSLKEKRKAKGWRKLQVGMSDLQSNLQRMATGLKMYSLTYSELR